MSSGSDGLQPIGGLQPVGAKNTPAPADSASGSLQPVGGAMAPVAPPPPPAAAPLAPPSPSAGPAATLRPASPTLPPREQEEDKLPVWFFASFGTVAALILIGVVSLFLPAPSVPAPEGYTSFAAKDNSFICDLPKGWNVTASGKAAGDSEKFVGFDGVTATKNDARVEVTVSTISGLIAGQLMFGSDPIPSGAMGSRSGPIFKSHGRFFKKQYRNYAEEPYSPSPENMPKMSGIVTNTQGDDLMADFKWSEFTADGPARGLGGKRHGYRAAIGGGEYIASVVCECSERDWEKLQPAFEHIIADIHETRPRSRDMDAPMGVPGAGSMPSAGSVPGFGSEPGGNQ